MAAEVPPRRTVGVGVPVGSRGGGSRRSPGAAGGSCGASRGAVAGEGDGDPQKGAGTSLYGTTRILLVLLALGMWRHVLVPAGQALGGAARERKRKGRRSGMSGGSPGISRSSRTGHSPPPLWGFSWRRPDGRAAVCRLRWAMLTRCCGPPAGRHAPWAGPPGRPSVRPRLVPAGPCRRAPDAAGRTPGTAARAPAGTCQPRDTYSW